MDPMKKFRIRKRLKELGKQMAEHTHPVCSSGTCPEGAYKCCDDLFCSMAVDYAKKNWGVELETVSSPAMGDIVFADRLAKLPARFLGAEGCTVEPHLRPACTHYVCGIRLRPSGLIGTKGAEWDARYVKLINEIAVLSNSIGLEP
tara:strand:- start:7 stop:444 length:438 start_codon:yes stop_codon:yes gene_type:complete